MNGKKFSRALKRHYRNYTKKEAKEDEIAFGLYSQGVYLNREARKWYELMKGNKRVNKAISRNERNGKKWRES